MKKILLSVSIIAAVAAVVFGVTTAFFSDTEKSTGNTFTAGTIDISVAGQNPWNTTYPMLLDKPCDTNYINFTIRNVGENPANVWKRINNVATNGGAGTYSCVYDSNTPVMVSSEPECEEGTGNYTHSYVERDNLTAYMIYDMYICHGVVNTADCPVVDSNNPATSAPDLTTPDKWISIIPAVNQVRIDNINGIWIKLDKIDKALAKGEALAVSQSYHLMAWNDAGEETITNWAQGDVMTFDIELEARQLIAPPPTGVNDGTLTLENKDPVTWQPIADGFSGILSYSTSGPTFNFNFTGVVPQANTSYCLIYYADPWPGQGKTNNAGMDLKCGVSGTSGELTLSDNVNTGDLPHSDDLNSPAGAKLQVVLDADYDNATDNMTAWNPTKYLFEMNFITYHKL